MRMLVTIEPLFLPSGRILRQRLWLWLPLVAAFSKRLRTSGADVK